MSSIVRACSAALFLCFYCLATAHAQNSAAFLRNMPTAAEIEAAYPLGGKDPTDAAARRAAAYRLAGVVIAKSGGRDGSPAKLSREESKVYRDYNDAGPLKVRADMDWPRVACGGDKECQRYDSLVTDYVWGDKKKAERFAMEFNDKLFAGKEEMLPEEFRYTKTERAAMAMPALLTLVAGLAFGFLGAMPWKFVREGAINSLGSGIARANPGPFGLAYNSRNHVTIGEKKLGTTIASPRIDDALGEAMNLGAPVRVGLGWTLWRNFALSVKSPGETVREPFLSFVLQTFAVTPVLGVIGVVGAAILGAAVGSGYVSVFAMAFVATYTLGVMAKNLLAWQA